MARNLSILGNQLEQERWYPAVKTELGQSPLFSMVGMEDGSSANSYNYSRKTRDDIVDQAVTTGGLIKDGSNYVTKPLYDLNFPLNYFDGMTERVHRIDDANKPAVAKLGLSVEMEGKEFANNKIVIGNTEIVGQAKDGVGFILDAGSTPVVVSSDLIVEDFAIDLTGGLNGQLTDVIDQLMAVETTSTLKLEFPKQDARRFGMQVSPRVFRQLEEDKAFGFNDPMALSVMNQDWMGAKPNGVLTNGTPIWKAVRMPVSLDGTNRVDYIAFELAGGGESTGSVKHIENLPVRINVTQDPFNSLQDLIEGNQFYAYAVVKPDLVAIGSSSAITVTDKPNTRGQKIVVIANTP